MKRVTITAKKSFMKKYFGGRNNVPRDTSTKVSTYKLSNDETNQVPDKVFLKGKRRVKDDDVISGCHLGNIEINTPCPNLESRAKCTSIDMRRGQKRSKYEVLGWEGKQWSLCRKFT